MELKVIRYNKAKTYTDGMLFIDGGFECYTIEDAVRDEKIYGKTAIPAGEYQVELRTVGGWHERESKRYTFHKGMLWIKDVPNFQYILIHAGNTSENTDGCLLVGSTAIKDQDFIGASRDAYAEMYQKVIEAFDRGEDVCIKFEEL